MTILLLILIVMSPSAFADMFAIQNPDGSVEIINNADPEQLEENTKENGQWGYPIKRIDSKDLPPQEDHKFWRFNDVPLGEKITVDEAKKANDHALKQADKTDKKNARKKICPNCTDNDFKKAFGD